MAALHFLLSAAIFQNGYLLCSADAAAARVLLFAYSNKKKRAQKEKNRTENENGGKTLEL